MLKRSWPRSSSSLVTLISGGIWATGLLSGPRPVKTAPSPRSPRAMVWAGNGRAPWPSAKKVLAPSGLTLCWSCMFSRQPEASRQAARARTCHFERRGVKVSVVNVGHLVRVQAGQEAPGGVGIEFRVPRLDHQEEAVAGRQGEARHVEH